jgi:hypothetical protein
MLCRSKERVEVFILSLHALMASLGTALNLHFTECVINNNTHTYVQIHVITWGILDSI